MNAYDRIASLPSATGTSFAQAAFRDQVARLARIDWRKQEEATERLVRACPLPWDEPFKMKLGEELARREAQFAKDVWNAKATARDSNTVLIGGPSPRLQAIRSLTNDIERGSWGP